MTLEEKNLFQSILAWITFEANEAQLEVQKMTGDGAAGASNLVGYSGLPKSYWTARAGLARDYKAMIERKYNEVGVVVEFDPEIPRIQERPDKAAYYRANKEKILARQKAYNRAKRLELKSLS
jgi:hypothetical protein